MHIAAKLAIGAGIIGAGALALAACGNDKAPQEPQLADDDVLGAADRATSTDSMMQIAHELAVSSGRPATEAVQLLRSADRHTSTDATMLGALQIGLQSRASAGEFEVIARAADDATSTDASLLSLLALNQTSRFTPQEYARAANAADRHTSTDATMMSMLTIAEHSGAPVDQVERLFAEADRATSTDASALSLAHDLLRQRDDSSYPTPDEIPGSGNYPTGPTSGGDDGGAAGIYLEGHSPQGGDPAADAAR